MKTSRRDFLKGLGALAAGMVMGAVRKEDIEPESQDEVLLPADEDEGDGGIAWDLDYDQELAEIYREIFEYCECEPPEIQLHYGECGEAAFSDSGITEDRSMFLCGETGSGTQVYLSHDKGETWQSFGDLEQICDPEI